MGGFFLAWAVGEGMITWRWVKNGAPPPPGALLAPSGMFLALAIAAEYAPARTAVTAFAWAVDLAILLQLVGKEPKVTTGWPPPKIADGVFLPGGTAAAASTTATTPAATGGSSATSTAPPPTLA